MYTFETLREVATEGEQGPGDIGFRLKIRKPAEEKKAENKVCVRNITFYRCRMVEKSVMIGLQAAKDEEADADRDEILSSIKNRDYPAFLGQAGQRIATFSRLLKRFGDVMIRDFGVPETYSVNLLHIF